MNKIIVTQHGFANVNNIVSFFVSDTEISYIPVYGHANGGYSPFVVKGSKERIQIIYNELIEFFADPSCSMYNAKARMEELNNACLKK